MPWRESLAPRRMARVAVVAPEDRFEKVLAAVGTAGVLEPDLAVGPDEPAATTLTTARVTEAAVHRDGVGGVVGWAPADRVGPLRERIAPLGGGVVELPVPPGREPPTLLATGRGEAAVRPLVEGYTVVPYRDLDPTWFAAAAFVVMFGMMFGDVGDGLLLAAASWWLRGSRGERLRGVRRVWPLGVAMGLSAAVFGVLYGEFFGPTGLVPPLWLDPLDEPVRLLGAAVVLGAALLGVAYALGTANRWREGGPAAALYAPTGVSGTGLFAGVALGVAGALTGSGVLVAAGAVTASLGLLLVATGLKGSAGPGAAGTMQAAVELFDVVIRLGSNVMSFARLAAFGLTHAALGLVVWQATTAVPDAVPAVVPGLLLAAVVFVAGHVVTFALEALVAGVQALRLEYYELFSRVFAEAGRAFRPWHLPSDRKGSP